MKFFLILIVLVGVVISIFKSQENNTAQSSQAKVVQDRVNRVSDSMSVEKVKKLTTNYNWSIGLSQWSRSLQLSDCAENQCTLQVVFSTPQICPVGTKDDEWCDEIELSGKIQFAANGFNFIDDKNAASGFCELKNDSAPDSWKLEGVSCPSNLQELRGNKN